MEGKLRDDCDSAKIDMTNENSESRTHSKNETKRMPDAHEMAAAIFAAPVCFCLKHTVKVLHKCPKGAQVPVPPKALPSLQR